MMPRFQLCMLMVVLLMRWNQDVDALVFLRTNLALMRPVVVGETVFIDCTTDEKSVTLNLLKKDSGSSVERILKPDNQLLKQTGQNFTILISSDKDSGIYTCDAYQKDAKIQKSLTVYIAAKISGAIPEPVIDEPTYAISEGRNLKIKCSTKGTFSKLSWEKEGVKVSNEQVTDRPIYYEGGIVVAESILTIEDVKLQDSGIYTCVSVSRFDPLKKASVTARVNVKGQKLYWISNNPQTFNSITAKSGTAIIISCALSHPAKKVKFYRAVSGSPLSEIRTNGGKYRLINDQELVVSMVSLIDYGSYACRVQDNLLEDKKIQLFINDLNTEEPSVFVTPSFLNLDFNDNGKITCTSYGRRVAIEWLRTEIVNGVQKLRKVPTEMIVATTDITAQGNIRRRQTINFTNVTVDDKGSYCCKATLGRKPVFKEVDVTIKKPSGPDIKRFAEHVTREGLKTSLNCRSRGAPNPTIIFFKDGKEIVSNSNGYVINGRKLSINKPIFPDHNGKYTCTVSNMFGKATRNSSLTVTVAPTIEKSKEIVVVGNQEDLKIECKIKRSNPMPKITWEYQPWPCRQETGYKCVAISSKWKAADPKDIKPADPFTMNSTFKVPKSSVKKFFIRCLANHRYGRDMHQVIGLIDIRDASALLKAFPEEVIEDEQKQFTITCTGEAGLFVKLSWEKDGKPIVPDGKIMKIVSTGSILEKHKSLLTITKATPKDSGLYECIGTPARIEDEPVISGSKVKIHKTFSPTIKSFENLNVVDGKKAVVKCTVDSHPVAKITWYKNGQPLTSIDKINSENDCKNRNEGSYFELVEGKQHKLIVCKAAWKINSGSYSCQATNHLGTVQKESLMMVYASPVMAYEQVDVYVNTDKTFSRNCSSQGNPSPFTWWEHERNGRYFIVSDNTTSGISYLNISKITSANYGNYRCVAANSVGFIRSNMVIRLPLLLKAEKNPDDNLVTTISFIAALIAALLIIIILIVLAVILYKRKRLYGGFYILSIPPSPDYFKKLDPTRPLSEQTNKLPYYPEWEYPRNKIKLKNCVGSGAFGEVYIADAVGIVSFDPRYKINAKHKPLLSRKRWSFTKPKSEFSRQDSVASTKSNKPLLHGKDVTTVAVKKLKEDATATEHKDLISELKILIHIGQNENIVNLLAACTKGVERECMVVLEYCPHGSLLSFMKDRRQMFKPIWSKQHLGMEKELTTFDLCVAGYQVAMGLDYLASRKLVHRDIAARNVLVGENYVMKVADFGLARDVYQDEQYVKVSGGLLPIKWMAIESIFDRVFTCASDVWSFGVLMWEVMTLGSNPYPGIPTKGLPEYLSRGDRMDQPGFCPNEVFQIILETWNELPSHRPSFSDIVFRLAGIIESNCNNPDDISYYLNKNHMNGGVVSDDGDYLKAVDSTDIGSYKFQPPPSYSSSVGGKPMVRSSTRSSERYVSDNRFKEDDSSTTMSDKKDFDNTIDSRDGSEKSIEPKAKLDEMISEKDMIAADNFLVETGNNNMNNNEGLYQNEALMNRRNKEAIKMDMPDEDKDIDEKKALLDSPTNYINT